MYPVHVLLFHVTLKLPDTGKLPRGNFLNKGKCYANLTISLVLTTLAWGILHGLGMRLGSLGFMVNNHLTPGDKVVIVNRTSQTNMHYVFYSPT